MPSTIISWGLTVCLIGAALYVYRPDVFAGIISQRQEVKPVVAEPPSRPPVKKQKSSKGAAARTAVDTPTDVAGASQSGKKRKIASAPVNTATVPPTAESKHKENTGTEGDGLSDKDFAKQLAQTQSGNKLQVPQKQQPSKKERRFSKLGAAHSPDPSGASTEASSTTGRDADDDLTPGESPEAGPIYTPVSRAGDISDMLEAPAAKPTTLRLTDVSNEAKAKKPANKAFEPVLSKKKRNEKQRKEEAKLAREEADRIHEAKKQEQLRRARMAAGTSNQTKADNFAAKANAWQSGASNTVKAAPANTAEPLLDTFDSISSTAAPAHGAVHTESTQANGASDLKMRAGEGAAAALTAPASREGFSSFRQEYGSEISEEDQMRMLQEQQQDDAWESVTNKKSKKKGKPDNDSASGASSPVRSAPISVKPQANSIKTNGVSKKAETPNRFDSFHEKVDSGLQDAEWEA